MLYERVERKIAAAMPMRMRHRSSPNFNLPVPVKFFFTGKVSGGNFSGSREETEKPFAVGPWVDVLDIPPFASGGTRWKCILDFGF